MVDHEVLDSQLKTDRFPFPSEGDITLRVRNANYTLGPVMLHIGMKPGAVIPAHLHKGMAEARSISLRATSRTRASSTRPALRCISRPARYTARTPLRMDAGYSSSGRSALRKSLLISATSPSQPKGQPSGNHEAGVARPMPAQRAAKESRLASVELTCRCSI